MTLEITNIIKQSTNLTDAEIKEFTKIATIKTYKTKQCFLRAGKTPIEFGFVLSGLFKYSYISESGDEYINVFMPENGFLSSYNAMITSIPSSFYIEAIEDSEVLVVPYAKWQILIEKNPKWKSFLIQLLEQENAMKEQRERQFLLQDAETRYKEFIEKNPIVESRVKQYMIASYIGITPIALSRIRKQMSA